MIRAALFTRLRNHAALLDRAQGERRILACSTIAITPAEAKRIIAVVDRLEKLRARVGALARANSAAVRKAARP